MSGRLLLRRVPSPELGGSDNESGRKLSSGTRKRRRSFATNSASSHENRPKSAPRATACDSSDDSSAVANWSQRKKPPAPANAKKAWYDSSSDESTGKKLKPVAKPVEKSKKDTDAGVSNASESNFRNNLDTDSDSSHELLGQSAQRKSQPTKHVASVPQKLVYDSSDDSSVELHRYQPRITSGATAKVKPATTSSFASDDSSVDIPRRTYQPLPISSTKPSGSANKNSATPRPASRVDDPRETSSVDTLELDRRLEQQERNRQLVMQKHAEDRNDSPPDDVFVLPDQPDSSSSDCSDHEDEDTMKDLPVSSPRTPALETNEDPYNGAFECDSTEDRGFKTGSGINHWSEEQHIEPAVPEWQDPLETPHRDVVDLCQADSTGSRVTKNVATIEIPSSGPVRQGLRSTMQYYPALMLSSARKTTQLQDDIEVFSDDEYDAGAVSQLHQHRRTVATRNSFSPAVLGARESHVNFDSFQWNDAPDETTDQYPTSAIHEHYATDYNQSFHGDTRETPFDNSHDRAYEGFPNAESHDHANPPRPLRDPFVVPRLPRQSFLSAASTRATTSLSRNHPATLPRWNASTRVSNDTEDRSARSGGGGSSTASLPPAEDFSTNWAPDSFRNDLTGGSGAGADSTYQFAQRHANAENEVPAARAWTQRGGRKSKKTATTSRSSTGKGGTKKRGGFVRGRGGRRGRGRGGARAPPAAGSTWAGNVDDPNLRHVGGADMSF